MDPNLRLGWPGGKTRLAPRANDNYPNTQDTRLPLASARGSGAPSVAGREPPAHLTSSLVLTPISNRSAAAPSMASMGFWKSAADGYSHGSSNSSVRRCSNFWPL
jgi:hypothetical protein